MEPWIRLVGAFCIVGVILYVSYLVYDKNQFISGMLIAISFTLAAFMVVLEVERRRYGVP